MRYCGTITSDYFSIWGQIAGDKATIPKQWKKNSVGQFSLSRYLLSAEVSSKTKTAITNPIWFGQGVLDSPFNGKIFYCTKYRIDRCPGKIFPPWSFSAENNSVRILFGVRMLNQHLRPSITPLFCSALWLSLLRWQVALFANFYWSHYYIFFCFAYVYNFYFSFT